MKRIYKYELGAVSPQTIWLPKGAEILTAQGQHGRNVCIWALIDPEQPDEQRSFDPTQRGAEAALSPELLEQL
jgi:hypothetical protein